jgi:hypothetical protein
MENPGSEEKMRALGDDRPERDSGVCPGVFGGSARLHW